MDLPARSSQVIWPGVPWCSAATAAVHPCIVRPLTPVLLDVVSLRSGQISMKLGTNINNVSGHCWSSFQGRRSKVRVIAGSRKFRTWHNISVLGGLISAKFATNIYHSSGHCWKGFQGQRSKVKVMVRPSALLRWRLTFQQCGVEAHLFELFNLLVDMCLVVTSSAVDCLKGLVSGVTCYVLMLYM